MKKSKRTVVDRANPSRGRLLKTIHIASGLDVKTYHSNEWDEFRVMIERGGKVYDKETYFTTDKTDALDTAKLLAAALRSERRPNPVRLKNGRVLTLESCTVKQAAELMDARQEALRAGTHPPSRDKNCSIQSAQVRLHYDGKLPRKGAAEPAKRSFWSIVSDWWTPTGMHS